jgi:hypothetical protein
MRLMQMTDSFGAAVAVTIPILALAAGGEARSIRERIQKPHEQWEQLYQRHQQQHPLDLDGSADSVLEHLLDLPKLPVLFRVERAIAVLGAIVWLLVFSVLTVVELLTLLWLADGEPSGHGDLAAFALWSIGVGFLALIVAPMAYLAMPVMLALDLVPAGLRGSLAEQAASGKGRQVAKDLAKETGGALDRLADRLAEENPGKKNIHVSPSQFVKLIKQELAESRSGQSLERDAGHPLEPDSASDTGSDSDSISDGTDGVK